jgi:hypothetical protein
MITQDELIRLKALCARATPGPWEVRGSTYVGNGEKMIAEIIFGRIGDPEFIAAAREALPALIEEVERLTAENFKFRVALRLPDAGVEEIEHRYTWEVEQLR